MGKGKEYISRKHLYLPIMSLFIMLFNLFFPYLFLLLTLQPFSETGILKQPHTIFYLFFAPLKTFLIYVLFCSYKYVNAIFFERKNFYDFYHQISLYPI